MSTHPLDTLKHQVLTSTSTHIPVPILAVCARVTSAPCCRCKDLSNHGPG